MEPEVHMSLDVFTEAFGTLLTKLHIVLVFISAVVAVAAVTFAAVRRSKRKVDQP